MYYGDKRESKVNICHTLQSLGWTIYGYKEDQSDSMSDYYDPAYWEGIATKNGYTLVIDVNDYSVKSYSGRTIERYTMPPINAKTNAKIAQLKILSTDRGATEGEKTAALAAIERLQNKLTEEKENAEKTKEIICVYPEFQANPPHTNWHIEKDGVIIDKGRGAFQFHDLPFWVDHMTGENKEERYTWKAWTLSESQQKDLKKFQAFIKKVEAIAAVKIGNDDGAEAGYKKITVTEYKTELKAEEITLNNFDEELEPGIYFKLKSNFNYGCFKGNIYKIEDDKNERITSYRMNKKLDKALTGRATSANRFNVSYEKFKKWVIDGAIVIVKLVEVKTPYEVEKYIKETTKRTKRTTTEKETNTAAETVQYEYDIKPDIDTRDGSAIFVVKILDKLDRDEYINTAEQMKKIGGYYSKFKHGFLFKNDPTEAINTI